MTIQLKKALRSIHFVYQNNLREYYSKLNFILEIIEVKVKVTEMRKNKLIFHNFDLNYQTD